MADLTAPSPDRCPRSRWHYRRAPAGPPAAWRPSLAAPDSAWRRTVAAALAIVWLAGCASPAAVRPIPELGPQYALEKDEKRLWDQSREEERKLTEKLKLVDDPLLADYVENLGQSMVDPATRQSGQIHFRFRVVEDPTLNAFAFPTGSVYVHSGLIARTDNEAQLALVLGHEVTHVEERHALKHQRSAQRRMIGFGIAAAAASIVVAGEAGKKAEKGDYSTAAVINQTANIILGVGLQLAFIAAIQGYGRALEREADEGGMAKMVSHGYDPRQAPELFALLLKEHPDPGKMERFFFSSHPANIERRKTAEEVVSTRYAQQAQAGTGKVSSPDFEQRRWRVLRDDARLNLEAGRIELAEEEIAQVLSAVPRDPVALSLRGSLHQRRASESAGDAERKETEEKAAISDYSQAVKADPTYAPPHRELGILYMKRGERAQARIQFGKYLDLAPQAPDTRMVRDYLAELGGGGEK
jgi:predicted Zn-dependent protease